MSQHCDNATFQILRYRRTIIVATADRAEVDKLFARISAVSEVAELYNFPVVEYDEQGSLLSPHAENREVEHRHTT